MKLIKKNRFQHNKGSSLFELMMAVLIMAMTLVAIIGLVSVTINNSTFSRDKTQATRYTNQAVEWMRSQRDADWPLFVDNGLPDPGKKFCLSSLDFLTIGSCSLNIGATKFKREAVLIFDPLVNASTVEVRVITSWEDNSGYHESRLSTYFTNWRTK